MDTNHSEKHKQEDGHKILVVDDEMGIRRGCERVLRSEGHRVLLAEGGKQGIEALKKEPDIDLVLVDLRMPGMSGHEFLAEAAIIAPETVFVMITAYATIEAAVEATKRGAYDFIAKPFAPDDLLRIVHRALERARLLRERNRLKEERQQQLLELMTEQSRLRMIIDCMTDGVLVCNAEQVLVLYNPAALKLVSCIPSDETPLDVETALQSEELAQMISVAATQRKRLSGEIRLGSGSEGMWILANVAPVSEGSSGQFLGTVSVLRDITEMKRVEQIKAQFVNMVAHELRSPLSAVDGFLSLLEQGYVKEEEKRQELIARSRQRIGALVDLVSDLLDGAQIEAGTVRREISPQDIEILLGEVMSYMKPLAEKNQVHMEMLVPKGLPPVQADKEDLIRLFTNLVSNGIKYNKRNGSVRIVAEQEGPYLKVAVVDTGIGVGKEGLGRLFTEFFREKKEETRDIKGTGLGLSIVKATVDFYHGQIEAESEIGKGTTFTVRLPFQSF